MKISWVLRTYQNKFGLIIKDTLNFDESKSSREELKDDKVPITFNIVAYIVKTFHILKC